MHSQKAKRYRLRFAVTDDADVERTLLIRAHDVETAVGVIHYTFETDWVEAENYHDADDRLSFTRSSS